jgi:hypothetical protein
LKDWEQQAIIGLFQEISAGWLPAPGFHVYDREVRVGRVAATVQVVCCSSKGGSYAFGKTNGTFRTISGIVALAPASLLSIAIKMEVGNNRFLHEVAFISSGHFHS